MNKDNLSIQFEPQRSLKNGNKLTNKNWHKVVAISNRPCTNVKGVVAIDNAIRDHGAYFEKWVLKYEEGSNNNPAGFIFREVNHNGGISGRHHTHKQAVWSAANSNHITVWIEG